MANDVVENGTFTLNAITFTITSCIGIHENGIIQHVLNLSQV
jgi:hypothetical protein